MPRAPRRPVHSAPITVKQAIRPRSAILARWLHCTSVAPHEYPAMESQNLEVLLPTLFLLGLAVMGLLFAFASACERV